MSLLHHDVQREALAVASHFRDDFFDCLTAQEDTLFELTDALLCVDGPVTTPVDLTLTAEHRRGHGAMYDALNRGNVDVPRLRQVLAGLPQPQAAEGRLVLAVDVTHWLRPDAPTSADRLFCHVYGRSGRSSDQFVPGWPYSFVAALESGRTSWSQTWMLCGWAQPTTSLRSPPTRSAASSRTSSTWGVGTSVTATSWSSSTPATTLRAWPTSWKDCRWKSSDGCARTG
jgi:hypothetical protein